MVFMSDSDGAVKGEEAPNANSGEISEPKAAEDVEAPAMSDQSDQSDLSDDDDAAATEAADPEDTESDISGAEEEDELDEVDEEQDDWRETVVAEFSSWLYELTDEELEDIEAEADTEASEPDLLTLFGEFTALRQELRQQSRVFKTAADGTVAGMVELRGELSGQARSLEAAVIDIKSQIPAARREAREGVIAELLAVRDAIADAVKEGKGMPVPKASWFSRSDPRADAIIGSATLALAKADDALRRLGVTAIAEPGVMFDSKTMRAVAVAADSPSADGGKVVTIYRQGYACDGRILRPAEVEVAK